MGLSVTIIKQKQSLNHCNVKLQKTQDTKQTSQPSYIMLLTRGSGHAQLLLLSDSCKTLQRNIEGITRPELTVVFKK